MSHIELRDRDPAGSGDYNLVGVLDQYGALMGYRLVSADHLRGSRLYLSREDAIEAWTNRCIEIETELHHAM